MSSNGMVRKNSKRLLPAADPCKTQYDIGGRESSDAHDLFVAQTIDENRAVIDDLIEKLITDRSIQADINDGRIMASIETGRWNRSRLLVSAHRASGENNFSGVSPIPKFVSEYWRESVRLQLGVAISTLA
jgi:hypothetical protein